MNPTTLLRRSALGLGAALLLLGAAGCSGDPATTSVEAGEPIAGGNAEGEPAATPPIDPAVLAEVDASMAATARACSQPASVTPEGATAARDVVPGKIAVVGSDGTTCLMGVADLIVVSDTEPIPDYVPVYDADDPDRVIGYWSDGYGWVTPAQRNDPAFDLDAHRAAYAYLLTSGVGRDRAADPGQVGD